ncbi:MAG: VPLPA-CTERM sorting domain-containing protein [Desulfobacterium sp.]|nr:VPLPA-CTERM sorting domain-containing protein [Desulfobacterium sp.]
MKKLSFLFQTFKNIYWVIVITCISVAMPASAATVFSDNSFNLADYTVETFQTGGAVISTIQTLSAGNPGPALQTVIEEPAFSGVFYTRQYFMNSSFLYDTNTQGAVQSIDFIGDAYLEAQSLNVTDRGIAGILYQNSRYYVHAISTPPINAVWQTGSANGLLSSDFDLVTNLLTTETDVSSHPDFNNGVLQFGILMGTYTIGNTQPIIDVRVDNLSYTVNSVPLPTAGWLLFAGILSLSGVARSRNKRE